MFLSLCESSKINQRMNLHEYQGKEILSSFGVRVQRGIVAQNPAEAVEAAKQLTEQTGTQWYVVKKCTKCVLLKMSIILAQANLQSSICRYC